MRPDEELAFLRQRYFRLFGYWPFYQIIGKGSKRHIKFERSVFEKMVSCGLVKDGLITDFHIYEKRHDFPFVDYREHIRVPGPSRDWFKTRNAKIYEMRRSGKTLRQLGGEFGLCAARIDQICKKIDVQISLNKRRYRYVGSRPIDMGGPRDRWLSYTPENAFE